MSISSSLYTSKSSLICLGKKLEVLGDNIANISTTGFRASRVSFEDILLKATNTGGVKINPMGPTSDFSKEGSAESTDMSTNMAISGDGFFILKDKDDTSSTYYTRAGEFNFNSDGSLVNPGGHIVQGYAFDNQGTEGTTLADIKLELTTPDPTPGNPNPVPRLVSSPSASTRITLLSNVDAGSQDNSPDAVDEFGLFDNWDATSSDPIGLNDYEHRAEHHIYDSSGDRHSIGIYYDMTSQDNIWEYLITSPPEGTATASDDGVLARGTITFGSNGYIDDMSIENYLGSDTWEAAGTPNSNGYLTFKTTFDGVDEVELDMGVTYVDGDWQHSGQTTTQFGYGSYTKFSNTDGYGEGDFLHFSVSSDGIIMASFDNGVISDLFRVGLANAMDPSGRLKRIGSTLFQAASESQSLTTDIPGSSGLGTITGGSVETSNVDMVEQFGELIFTQRALQANSKGIIAADEMLKTIIALKR